MQFLYNENREVVAEKDYSGNIIRYIRGLGLISSDSENAKTYYHYVCDEQGSVSRIIRGEDKENGAAAQDKVSDRVLNHYEYDAFGNTISCEERVANRFRYQSGSTSKYLEQLDNLSENKINHMIDGSKNSNHGWEKLVPDKNWSDIKNIIADVMDTGVEGPYKSVFLKKATINGFEVEVTYTKLSDGTIKISDAWVNQ